MKKFMIFLLMAFLYLGTCQARSEASHPNNGKLKLLSWVTPAPDQSFLTPSGVTASPSDVASAEDAVFAVSIVGYETGCPGQPITLTAVIDGPLYGEVSYLWKMDGEAAPGTNNEQVYQFTPTEDNVFGDGQTHEFTVEVSPANCVLVVSPVHPFTMMDFTITLTGPAYTCASTSSYDLVATVASTSGSEPVSYQWYKGTTLYATTTVNVLTVSAANLSNKWVVKAVYNMMECSPESDTLRGAEIPALELDGDVELADPTSPVCVDAPVTFTVTNTLAVTSDVLTLGDPIYEWYVDGQLAATTNGTTFTTSFGNTGTHNVMVKPVYDNYDCTVIPTDSKTVEAVAAPNLTINGSNMICDGQTSNIITASAGYNTYIWTKPDGSTVTVNPTADNPTVTLDANVPGYYTLVATAASGCTATADFTVYQFGGDLQVQGPEYNVCPGDVITMHADYQGLAGENITYSWTGPGTATDVLGTGSALTVTVPATASGIITYHVTATSAAGCSITYDVNVNVLTPTQALFTVTVNKTSVCEGDQVTASVVPAEGNNYTGLYDWFVNGVQVPGEHASVITMNMNEAGSYIFAAMPANTVCTAANLVAANASNTVTVNTIPEITVTGDNVVCQNATATIAATDIAGANYTWAGPVGFTAATNNRTQTTTIPGVYSVTASKGGCESTADFTIYQLGGDLQLYASELSACEGGVITLNANLDGFGNQNITYDWTVEGTGATLSATTGSTVGLTMGSADVTVAVTAHATGIDNTAFTSACAISDTIEITKLTSPALAKVSVTSPESEHMCVGDQVVAVAYGPDESTVWAGYVTWYLDGVEVPGQNLPNLALNLFDEGTHTIAAKAYDDACGTSPVKTATKHPKVHAMPEITITGNNVICNGSNTTLTANFVPANNTASDVYPTYSVAWTGPKTGNGFTLTTNLAGVYTATVTEQLSHCVATADFTVYTTGADLQVVADQMSICEGETVTLNANLDGFVNENVEYEWSNGETNPMISVTPTTSHHEYTVTATAGGCDLSGSIDITVHAAPSKPSLELSTHNICAGEQVTLTADHPGSGNNYTYTWYQNGIEIPGENTREITVTLNEAGEYMFRVSRTNAYGCTSQLTTPTNDYKVTVHEIPVVTLSGDQYYTTDATTATITSSVTPAGNYTYAWSNGEATPDITVGTPGGYGVYTLTVTSEYGCVAVSEPFTVGSVVDLQVNITGAEAACQHDIVTLSAVVNNDLEGHTYKWLVNNQYILDEHGITGSTTAHLTFPVDSIYKYYGEQLANEFTVEIYREGCVAPVISPVHPFLITPVPYVVVSAPEKVCEGSDAVLEAIVYQIGDNAQYQYQWYQDDEETTYGDPIDYVNTITIPAADVQGHQYAVKVIYQDAACSSDISAFVPVQIYEAPAAISLHMDPSTICTTNQASVWITDANANAEGFGAATYTWYVNGFAMPLAQSDTLVIDFDHNGAYTFWATAQYAEYPCGLNYTDTLTENVVMHPTVQITGDPIICHTDPVILYANLNDTVGTMNYTFEWRLYNYTLGEGTGFASLFGIIDNPDFLSSPILSTAVLGTDNFIAVDPNLGFPAQDYPYIFTVVVTTPEGCHVESEPYYVYVGAEPEVVATVDYTEVCANGEITATAHLGNWNMDNLVAIWQYSLDGGVTWTNIDYGTSGILHHVPGSLLDGVSGDVMYRIRVEQTTTGCVAYSDPVTVSVIVPDQISSVVAINHDINFITDNVCEGAQLDVAAYMIDEDGNEYINHDLNYMWKLNGMELQTIHGPEFSAQAYIYDGDPVDYTYEAYIVYDIPGCAMVPVASNTVHVKRNPIVTIDGNPNVCYYGASYPNVSLLAWVDGDDDLDATYNWFESGHYRPNTLGADNSYSEIWTPTYDNPLIFTVEVTNGDGCTSMSDPFYVNVWDKPEVNITGDADAICEGGEVTLRGNLDNYHQPLIVFQWYKNHLGDNYEIPGATHEIETFNPTTSTDYIVMAKHLTVFTLTEDLCVSYDTFHVDVNPIPVLHAEFLAPDQTSVCEGQTVSIIAGVVEGGVPGGEVYTWYRNGEEIVGFHESILTDNPVAVDGEPTVYHYAVSVKQSASGCESEILDTLPDITVNPNPVVELVTDPIVCDTAGNNITLLANVDPTPATPVSYKWMEDNAVLSITEQNTISFHRDYRDYPYSFSVELVNEYGCNAESSALVYVNAEPVVNITVTEDTICVGGQITLAAQLADWNADQLTYRWYDGNTPIADASDLTYSVVPTAGVHKYTIQIDQLTSLCHATSDTITVVVNNDPTVVINYQAAQYTVCDGYQVDLTTTVEGGVAGGEVYTWYRNGQVIEGANQATYSEVVSALNGEPTTYNYAVSVAQSAAGCESNVYNGLQTITVNPNPVLVLTTDPIVCSETEDNITLVANMDPATVGSNVTFHWMEDNHTLIINDVEVANTTENTITFHKDYRDYPYSFAVQVVNDYACSATSEALVYVNAAPIVEIAVSEDNICIGGEITLTANLVDWNADELTYRWYDYDNPMDNATGLSYTFVPELGVHKYTIRIDQLTSLCHATSDTLVVTVNPDPVIATVTASLYNVCTGSQLAITATPTDGYVDGEVYTWYRNGILMPGATAATIYDTPGTIDNNIQHYVYTAVVTRPQAGCTSLPVSSATVTVYPNPVVVITGDQHVCETDSVFLIANVDTTAFPVGNLHFTWYESGQIRDNQAYGLGDSRFYAEYMYPRDEPYIYTVNVERTDVEHGCASMSGEFYVYVYPQPVVTVTASDTAICAGGQVTLTSHLIDNNAEHIVYQWYEIRFQDVVSEIDYNVDHTYVVDTNTVAYRYFIPGANESTYTTTIDSVGTHTYGIMVIQTNSTCWNDDEISIVVNPIPVVTDVLVNGVSVDTVCDGAQVTLVAQYDANGTLGEPVFTWYRNGIEIEGANQAIFSENVYTTDNHVTYNYYSVVVTLPHSGCTSEMSSMAAQVRINPAPSTVSISGINVLCENDSTTLTAYSDVEGEWTWSTGSHEQSIVVPAGVYTVTMRTVEGCEMTSEPFTVEAFGTDLLVSASATSICRGEHTTLYVDQDGWQGNVTYLWDAQAGNSTATTVDVQPDSTTTYHVTATVSSTNGSCTAEGEVTIIVHQLPAPFEVTASTNVICEGQQITFTAPVDPEVTGYIWYQNGVEIPGENQNVITVNFNEAGQYTFAAKAISVEGCISAEASAPVTVTVNPAPSQVTITGINVLCENDSTVLTAQSDVPGIFVWSTGDTATTVTVPAGSYNVTIFTAEGCQLTSDNFNVEAFGTDLLVSASATSICQGEHTTLYVDQEGWEGNVTYLWDAQAGNSTATTVDVQPDQTTTYHVTATVNSTNGSCTAEGEVTIIVHPLPATLIVNATTPTTICQGDQVSFHATGDSTTVAYIWYQNGVEIPGENQADLTVNYNEYGSYSIAAKAISNEGCISALASEPVVVTVKPAPTTVTITGNNVLCMTDSTTLTAHSDVPGVFTWNDGTEGATLTVAAGVYNVTITTAEGCHLTSENFVVESFGTDVLVSASATSICQGEHTTLYVDQDGWQGNVTYLWDAQAGNSTATTVDVQPAATTTYHVTATVVAESGSCTAEGEVTIIVNPLPVVAAVTATDTVVCEGTQVTFTATGDENTTAYIWYNNGVEIAGENQAVLTVNFNEQGVYNYAVKAISNEGCVSAVAFNAPAVTVNAAPASVVISGNTVICDGGQTTLYANVVPNLPATYEWFKDNVSMNTNTESIVVTTAGSYKVVAAFNGCTTESEAVVVTVEQTPQLQLTATESVICAGGTTVITAEATGWNNADVNYEWSNNFEGSSFTFNPAYSGTYTFTVTASQATSGCTATDEITITVNELPAIPQVSVDNAIVCDGGQVTLTVTNPNNNAVYTWYRNGVVIAGATNSILTESPVTVDGDVTNYVYTVIATLPMSGCTSLVSSNTVVTVIPTPVVAVSVEGNTTICAGGSTTLVANVTPANANYSYQWYKDNVLIEGATSAEYTEENLVARETAYNYHVVVTANPGCNVTAYAPAITVVADPAIEAVISNNISCVGGTATLTAIVDGGVANVNGLNGYTFAWYRNNPYAAGGYSTTELIGSGAQFVTSANDPAGEYTYWVTVTSNYGCQSTSDVVNYTVIADPVVTISVAAGYPQAVCNGGESMLKANVTGGYGEISYQWYKNGNILVGETNQTLAVNGLAYGVNDVYTVEVAQTGVGCANNASAYINSLINVVPNYTVNITGFGNVCEGGELTLNATVNGVLNGDVLSYQWYRVYNGVATAIYGANAAQYQTSELLLGDSYEYYVVVTSNISGCSVVSTSVPANVVPAPTVTIQGASTVCEGGDLTLNAFVNGGVDGAAYTYTWTWTGAANGSATTAVPTFVPTLGANDLSTPYYFTVTISRNDNTGCTATSEAHEVNILAIPTVTVTADNSYICQNGEVTFTAHVSPVGTYNYVWTINGQQQAVNAATITTTLGTTGSINATVVVSAANASASCSATATIAAPVQVVATPTVTLAANHTTMCVGGVTTLTATVNANANIPGNFNYEWIVDGTPIAGVTNTLNQTLTAAGIHTYQVMVSQDNNLGCTSGWSNMATVQVAEQPVVNLTSADGLSICEGGSITLTGTVTNYGNTVNGVTNSDIYGNLVFDWTSNGVNVHHNTSTNAMNQVTETLNAVGNYTYQVTVDASGYNCQPQVSNEYTVSVNNNPTWVDVHVYSNNGTDACLGEMVYLFANIEGGVFDQGGITGGNIQWVVTDENGNTADVNGGLGGTSYDIPSVAGTYIYTPTFVGNIGSGCQLANTNDVQVAVTVHELPTAEFISGDGTALCANDPSASAELVIAFTGTAPFTYEVVDAAGNIIAHATTYANTATIYVSPEQQTTYRINLISDNFCENPAVGDATTVTVYVNEIEFADNFFVSGCNDDGTVTISFNMISGNPNAAFTVVYENGLQASGNIVNNTATFVVPTAPGDYNATITIDGCSYDIVVRVLVGDYGFGGTLPIMDQRWNDVVVVNNNPETNGGHVFVGFQWYHNGVAIPGATYSNYQDKGGLNGFYSVELTEQDADGNMITYMTCEMYFNSLSTVKVYPVPANVRQEITIELELTSEELEGAVLDIYSVTGAHVGHVTNLQPITKIEGFTAQGTYFGRILTGTNEIKTVKFIIVK